MPNQVNLKHARILAGYSNRDEIAHKMGVSSATIGNWEKGKSKPDVCQAYRLAKIYGLSVTDINWA